MTALIGFLLIFPFVCLKRGKLKRGDYLVAGDSWCKVKQMFDENGQSVAEAGPSQAVQVMGWKEVVRAGDEVLQMTSEDSAKELVDVRNERAELIKERADDEVVQARRDEEQHARKLLIKEKIKQHEDFLSKPADSTNIPTPARFKRIIAEREAASAAAAAAANAGKSERRTLTIILKADVDGSLEAILNVFETYGEHDKVKLDLIHFGIGAVSPSDLEMARTFNALIYCFNLPKTKFVTAADDLESKNNNNSNSKATVTERVRHFNVIYKLFDDLIEELNALAPEIEREEVLGEAQVLSSFEYDEVAASSGGSGGGGGKRKIHVAGGKCVDGVVDRKALFKVTRDNGATLVCERERCSSLKHLKSDVATVKRNVEFGLALNNQSVRVQPGDKIVCYQIKNERDKVQWNLGF